MRSFMLSLVLLFSASAFASPQFVIPKPEEYRATFTRVHAEFIARRDPWGKDDKGEYRALEKDGFVTFQAMLVFGWGHAHPESNGTPNATERMVENDWLGCVNVQFPDLVAQTEAAHFEEYNSTPTLFTWITMNHESAPADFIARLELLPDWAARCEAIVREDDKGTKAT